MTDKVGKAISGCKEREPIDGKNGDTIAGYNYVITLAPSATTAWRLYPEL